jgi:predicted kinase
MQQGILVISSGPALTGKSTFINGLRKITPSFVIISTDQIRYDLYGTYDFNPTNEPAVWSTAYAEAEKFLKVGMIVCLDATFRTPEYRGMVVNRFKKYPIIYFAFEKPELSLLLERNKKRTWKQFPEVAVEMMYHDYRYPTDSEKTYYYKVFEVSKENFYMMIEKGGIYLHELHQSKPSSTGY